ncbi:unnamed protein product, partial [Owenia fusiformis]
HGPCPIEIYRIFTFLSYFQNIVDLPDNVLLNIFQFFNVIELIRSFAFLHPRFSDIINNNSVLWKTVASDDQLTINKDNLHTILKHARCIEVFAISYPILHI